MQVSLSDTEVPVKHRGSARELVVAVDLMGRGFEVFKNLSAHGLDLLAMAVDGRVLRVEVKRIGNATQAAAGPWDVLAVVTDGAVIYRNREGYAVDPQGVKGAASLVTYPTDGQRLFGTTRAPNAVVGHLRRIFPRSATPKEMAQVLGLSHGSVRQMCLRSTGIKRVRRGEYVAKLLTTEA